MRQLLRKLTYAERHVAELFLSKQPRLCVLRFYAIGDFAMRIFVAHLVRPLSWRVCTRTVVLQHAVHVTAREFPTMAGTRMVVAMVLVFQIRRFVRYQ